MAPGNVTLDSVLQHEPSVISRMIDGEAVLVHPRQGKVRVLNPVGARLWELADGERTAGDVARIIADEYQVELPKVEADVLAFCMDLISRGVLNATDRTPNQAGTS